MKNTYWIVWSDEALESLKSILDYLEQRWTERETGNFVELLEHQLMLIRNNPYLFPLSDRFMDLRRSVLSSQTTIFYRIIGNEIHLISLFDNRQDPDKLKI